MRPPRIGKLHTGTPFSFRPLKALDETCSGTIRGHVGLGNCSTEQTALKQLCRWLHRRGASNIDRTSFTACDVHVPESCRQIRCRGAHRLPQGSSRAATLRRWQRLAAQQIAGRRHRSHRILHLRKRRPRECSRPPPQTPSLSWTRCPWIGQPPQRRKHPIWAPRNLMAQAKCKENHELLPKGAGYVYGGLLPWNLVGFYGLYLR